MLQETSVVLPQTSSLYNLSHLASVLLEKKIIILGPDQPFRWKSGYHMPIYCDNRKNISYHNHREIILSLLVEQVSSHDFDSILAIPSAGIPWAALLAQYFGLPLLVPIDGGYRQYTLPKISMYTLRYDAYISDIRHLPYGICFAHRHQLPFGYLRDTPKEHGVNKQIEGDIQAGSHVFVYSDAEVISRSKAREIVTNHDLHLFNYNDQEQKLSKIVTRLDGYNPLVIEDLFSTGKSTVAEVMRARDKGAHIDVAVSLFSYDFSMTRGSFEAVGLETDSLLTYPLLLDFAEEAEYLTAEQKEILTDWSLDPFGWGEKNGFPRVED